MTRNLVRLTNLHNESVYLDPNRIKQLESKPATASSLNPYTVIVFDSEKIQIVLENADYVYSLIKKRQKKSFLQTYLLSIIFGMSLQCFILSYQVYSNSFILSAGSLFLLGIIFLTTFGVSCLISFLKAKA